MARFYFHLHNDIEALDEEGTELPDLDAAQVHAQTLVRFEAAEAVKLRSHLVQQHHIDVADEHGRVLASVRFGDVVTIET